MNNPTCDFYAASRAFDSKVLLKDSIKAGGHTASPQGYKENLNLIIFLASSALYGQRNLQGEPLIKESLNTATDLFIAHKDQKLKQTLGYILDNGDWDFHDLVDIGFGFLYPDHVTPPSSQNLPIVHARSPLTLPEPKEALKERLKQSGKPADLDMAIYLAAHAFFGKTTRDGGPYLLHCLKVGLDDHLDPEQQIMGILHDLIEDTDWKLSNLSALGYSKRIIDGIDSLTKRPYEKGKDFDFIERLSLNPDAIDVKLADNIHNSDISRENRLPKEKHLEKQKVYLVQREYLIAVKAGEIKAGSSVFDFMQSREGLGDAAFYKKYGSGMIRSADLDAEFICSH